MKYATSGVTSVKVTYDFAYDFTDDDLTLDGSNPEQNFYLIVKNGSTENMIGDASTENSDFANKKVGFSNVILSSGINFLTVYYKASKDIEGATTAYANKKLGTAIINKLASDDAVTSDGGDIEAS